MKKIILLFLSVLVISGITSPSPAQADTLFGPSTFTAEKKRFLSKSYYHWSFHRIRCDTRIAEAELTIEKPAGPKAKSGYVFVNNRLISLKKLFRNNSAPLKVKLKLRRTNFMVVYFTGKKNSAIQISISDSSVIPAPTVSLTADPEGIPAGGSSTLTWASENSESCSISPDIGEVDLSGSIIVTPSETTTYTITATGQNEDATASATITVYQPPEITVSLSPEEIFKGESVTLSWETVNADTCTIDNGIGQVSISGSMTITPEATTTYSVTAQGPGGIGTETATLTVLEQYPPPEVNFEQPSVSIPQGSEATLFWTSGQADTIFIDNGIGQVSASDSMAVTPESSTTYTITAVSETGAASDTMTVYVTGAPKPAEEGSFGKQYQDLIPYDATIEAYDSSRFSLITGLVNDTENIPLSDVRISILSHYEYGTVTTDSDGRFTIPAEGDKPYTIVYEKEGYITIYRGADVTNNDIIVVDTVQMSAQDTRATTIVFDGNSQSVFTHRSSTVSDTSGTRSATLVFSGDNRAWAVDEEGNDITELPAITTRITEFREPDAMPAVLPPASAFTYCAEFAVDGVRRVRFDAPVTAYVNNFLGFDVGEIVPVGYYDRDRGVWIASENGVVVLLLDLNSDGITDALDADGDGQADDLNDNGDITDEAAGLDNPSVYTPGTTFWRVSVTHFTPWGCNWPWGPPEDATAPNPETAADTDSQREEEKDCESHNSSFVEDRSRIFHEDIPIPGTELTLHYASSRVSGYKHIIKVPASGSSLPASLKRIIVQVRLAGRTFEAELDPAPNALTEFSWDGTDYLGNEINDVVDAQVRIGFVYDGYYYTSNADTPSAFGQVGNYVTSIRSRQEITSWQHQYLAIVPDHLIIASSGGAIADGWTLSDHHTTSPVNPVLLKGNGKSGKASIESISVFAGSLSGGFSGDGGPASDAQLAYPSQVAVDSAGNVYFADYGNSCVRKIDGDGIITRVAGTGNRGYSGDNGPAIDAELYLPWGITLDTQDRLYISDTRNNRIRMVDENGIIKTIAGTGESGFSGDNGLAINATLSRPHGLYLDNKGNLFIADRNNSCIRKIDTEGIITTVAGIGGSTDYSGDGGPATQAYLHSPVDVFVDNSGSMYIADSGNERIRKVEVNGIISTFAGNGDYNYGNPTYNGDGIPATEAGLANPTGVIADASGNVYIVDSYNLRIRKVDGNDIITTVAGDGEFRFENVSGPAKRASIPDSTDIDIDAYGNLYIAGYYTNRIFKVNVNNTYQIRNNEMIFPDKNGLIYIMSGTGHHLKTLDMDTGVTTGEFLYDENMNLSAISDQFDKASSFL